MLLPERPLHLAGLPVWPGRRRLATSVYKDVITVSFTVSCQRPDYMVRTLESWSRVRGIEKAGMFLCLEHYLPWRKGEAKAAEAEKKFEGFEDFIAGRFPQARVVRNPARLGCLLNTRRAMQYALGQSEFSVLAEEDIEVSDDILEYFTWASEHYRNDPSVLAVCAHSVASAGGAGDVVLAPWFTPLVWGTWRSRWGMMLAHWTPQPGYPEGWDYNIRMLTGRMVQCAYPAMSRSQHFGAQSTMTFSSPVTGSNYFHDRSQSTTFQPHYEPQEFRAAEGLKVTYY